jgi:uncharacterized protein YciI
MHFAIHCLDQRNALATRLAHYDRHKAYLASVSDVAIVVSGPLLADDGETMIGSLFIVDADDRSSVERFHCNDPFFLAGVWGHVEIHPFLKRVDNRPETPRRGRR